MRNFLEKLTKGVDESEFARYDPKIRTEDSSGSAFISFRVVWVNTKYVLQCLDELEKLAEQKGCGWNIEAVDPYVYYGLLEKSLQS